MKFFINNLFNQKLKKKKVSVIIPFFNSNCSFFEKALDSVLMQSLEDIELICVDDGSTNQNCINLVNSYKKQDDRIIIIQKRHSGAGDSRNLGIKAAQGANIMFLDSDDYYHDVNSIEKMLEIKKEYNVKVVGSKHLLLKDNELVTPYFNYGDINEYFGNKIVRYIDYQFPWWYWCFLYDTDLIKENRLYFPNYLRYQDPPFFVKIMHKAELFFASDIITYVHRDSNNLQSINSLQAKEHLKGIIDLLKYSAKNNLDKLHFLLYKTFYEYDIKLLHEINYFSQKEINGFQMKINKVAKRQIIENYNLDLANSDKENER